MEIRILDKAEQARIYDAAYCMLEAADDEFVPPLSSRSSSTQRDLSGGKKNSDGIKMYFEQLKGQRFAAAYEDGELIAFVSYKENYTSPEIPPEELPNIYISTLVASPASRGKGVTKALYAHLFSAYQHANVFARTRSANYAHIKILQTFGFETVKVLKDDWGDGIDTVYFKKAKK